MKRRDWSWLGDQAGDMPHPVWVLISLLGMLLAVFGVLELASRWHH